MKNNLSKLQDKLNLAELEIVKPQRIQVEIVHGQEAFNLFKEQLKQRLKEDVPLFKMHLGYIEDDRKIILYQGVHSNIVARFNADRIFLVYRSQVQRRLKDLIDSYYQ